MIDSTTYEGYRSIPRGVPRGITLHLGISALYFGRSKTVYILLQWSRVGQAQIDRLDKILFLKRVFKNKYDCYQLRKDYTLEDLNKDIERYIR